MPNPVAVNDLSPISGSLQTSRISYGVETAGKNYGQNYNSTNWYSDIPNNGQFYTIISDNYTANYYVSRSNAGGAYVEGGLPAVDDYSAPVFWITAGTSSLDVITIVNGLPDRIGQVPFNSGSQALNWVASSSNYFAVGPDYYDQIDADSLVLYLDANQVISYPTTGSTWYDISGYTNNGTLINGTAWNSNGWFDFDGVDDYIDMGNPTILRNMPSGSIEAIYYRDSSTGTYQMIFTDAGSDLEITYLGNTLQFYIGNNGVSYTHAVTTSWVHVIGTWNTTTKTIYLNGTQVASNSNPGLTTGNRTRYLGSRAGSLPLVGNIADIRVYSKTLTSSDVAQNYYGGPIVTSSLLAAYDAGNLVSYPKSGTTLWNLSNIGTNNAVLTNGVSYNNIYGGTFNFDGADDFINLSGDVINYTSVTVEGWVFREDTTDLVNIVSGAGVVQYFGVYSQTLAYYSSIDTGGWTFGTTTLQPQTWYHVAITYDNSNYAVKMYLNGNLESTSTANASNRTGYIATIGVYANQAQRFWKGYISNLRIYSTALTQAQIQQNYNATK